MKKMTFVIIIGLLFSGCKSDSGLKIESPWARRGKQEGNSAAYFVLVNNTKTDEKLLSVQTAAASASELHMTKIDDQNKMMMIPQDFIAIPAGKSFELAPGGFHVMMLGLKNDLNDGETIKLSLQFENAGNIELNVPVKQP